MKLSRQVLIIISFLLIISGALMPVMPALAAEEAVQTPVVEEEVESTSIIEEDTEPLVEEETEPLVEGDTEPAPVEEEIEPPPVEEDTESTPIIDVIYQTAESKTITSGVTLDIITRFTEFGWQKIYVMKADLNDPYVHIDALTSSETIQNR